MIIYYESMTGNVRRFLARLGMEARDLRTEGAPREPFVLATYTFGRGEVPVATARFLSDNAELMRGVVVSGSYHWGETFGRAGDLISAQYGVPLIARINKSGQDADVETVRRWFEGRA